MMPLVSPKRTPVKGKPAVYSYQTRRGTRYIAVAIHDGKQRWLSGFTTAKLADEWREAEVVSMRQGRSGKAPVRMTLAEYIEQRWWPYAQQELTTNSVTAYKTNLLYVKQYLGDARLRDIDAEDVELFKAAMVRASLGPQTRKLAYARLRQALRQAVVWGLINRDPTMGIKAPLVQQYEAPEVTDVERRALLDEAEASGCGALVYLAVNTGLRWGELTSLLWEDVDIGARTLRVRQAKTRAGVRTVALGVKTVERLSQHMQEQMAWARKLGGTRPALVFVDANGKQFKREVFYKTDWNPLRRRVGLPRLHFHDLRHVHASLMGKAHVHPAVMQARLGHSKASFSLAVYTSADIEQQAEAAAAVEALVEAKTAPQIREELDVSRG